MNVYVGTNSLKNAYIGEYYEWNGDLSKASNPSSITITQNTQRINYGLQFNPNGTKCYTASYYIRSGTYGEALVQQFSLSTPRDITTATLEYSKQRGTYSNAGNYPHLVLANSGQYLYMFDNPYDGTKRLYKYSLGTAWDLSSTWTELANYTGTYSPLWWSSDGTKFIWTENENTLKYSETSTPRTPNFSGSTLISGFNTLGVFFSTDGYDFYAITGLKTITKYNLTTAWNPSAGMASTQTVTLSDITGNIDGFTFDTNGNNLYVGSSSNPTISKFYQYNLA